MILPAINVGAGDFSMCTNRKVTGIDYDGGYAAERTRWAAIESGTSWQKEMAQTGDIYFVPASSPGTSSK